MPIWISAGDGKEFAMNYGAFSHFRHRLAAAEGIDLRMMEGFRHPETLELGPTISWSDVQTPLRPFLDHPDDHGHLTPKKCAQMLPRLIEILDTWESVGAEPKFHTTRGRHLVEAMRACVATGKKLKFR